MSDVNANYPQLRLRFPTLRVKAKSLAAEARIIRHEEYRAKRIWDTETLNSLHSHRVKVVRHWSRITHLALAYLKGTPYLSVEQTTKEGHGLGIEDVKNIWLTVQRHAPASVIGESDKDVAKWVEKGAVRPNLVAAVEAVVAIVAAELSENA